MKDAPARSGRGLGLLAALAAVFLPSSVLLAQTADDPAGERVAVLQGLDKITGRVARIEAPIDQPIRFGTLEIRVRRCDKRPPEEPPESTAFLEISDIKPEEAPKPLFAGWMFASTPAVSALEHPVYDVWVIDCKMAAPAASRSR